MPTPPTEESLDRRLSRLDAQIKIEFDLIAHRVGWLLVSNSFLFTALAVLLNNTSIDPVRQRPIDAALWCLPIIGLLSSFLVVLAVAAAHNVIKELKVIHKKVEDEAARLYGYKPLGVDVKSWPHIVGNWPPIFLPPLLVFRLRPCT